MRKERATADGYRVAASLDLLGDGWAQHIRRARHRSKPGLLIASHVYFVLQHETTSSSFSSVGVLCVWLGHFLVT